MSYLLVSVISAPLKKPFGARYWIFTLLVSIMTPVLKYLGDFFAIVQNKMHWAAHGNTAAEIIHARADADKLNMGLTSWTGDKPRRADTEVAKNYLSAQELDVLNRIVSMYLDFAELQALHRKPMYMKDWIAKLDDFLRISERDILTHAGTISSETALENDQ